MTFGDTKLTWGREPLSSIDECSGFGSRRVAGGSTGSGTAVACLAPHVMVQAGQQQHWWRAPLGLACLLPLMGHNLHVALKPDVMFVGVIADINACFTSSGTS